MIQQEIAVERGARDDLESKKKEVSDGTSERDSDLQRNINNIAFYRFYEIINISIRDNVSICTYLYIVSCILSYIYVVL